MRWKASPNWQPRCFDHLDLSVLKSLVRRKLNGCPDRVVEGPKMKAPVSSASSSRSFHYVFFVFCRAFFSALFIPKDWIPNCSLARSQHHMAQADARRRVGGRLGTRWSQVVTILWHVQAILVPSRHFLLRFAVCSARLVLSRWVRTTWMRRRSSD